MKKLSHIFKICLVAILSISTLSACQQQNKTSDKLQVYASFYPLYDFAKNIGGDLVEVTNMVPPGTEPHDWEPSTTDMRNLEQADVFIYNGADLEHWTDSVLATLKNDKLTVVEASEGLTLLEGHSHDDEEEAHTEATGTTEEEHEHTHDPHVWLNPLNAKHEAEKIKDAFITADPDNKATYEKNYESYAKKLTVLDEKYSQTLAALPNKTIVVSHEAFGYLCERYGLEQLGIEGLNADSEPDAARMAEIIEFVKANNVKVIFFEELISPKVAETIASETHATTAVLNPIEGLTQEQLDAKEDYVSIMEQNLSALAQALS